MHSSISLSISSSSLTPLRSNSPADFAPINLRFCGLRREAFGFSSLKRSHFNRLHISVASSSSRKVSAALSANGSPSKFDYDLLIIGAGVGGHGAALHAVEKVSEEGLGGCIDYCIVVLTQIVVIHLYLWFIPLERVCKCSSTMFFVASSNCFCLYLILLFLSI